MKGVYEFDASATPPSPPATPSIGYPTSGNPGTGTPATEPGAWFFHMLVAELTNVISAGGIVTDHTVVNQLLTSLRNGKLNSTAGAGTLDAITAAYTTPFTALADGLNVFVRASGANTSTTPTLKIDALATKTIVKGNNLSLVAGDIAGAGHWLELQYDATLDKFVLQNPASSVATGLGFKQTTYTNQTGSRAIGTVYTNTTGRPIHVAIAVQLAASAGNGCRLLVGGLEVSQIYTPVAVSIFGNLQCIVPPAQTYQLVNSVGSNTLSIWMEQ
ncbi:hypothetical protein ACMYR3_06240 [Ampullimonas aquatilis]|uniref:hypothetical protein n=1 Tax=Ampullimonas aquatilis TaxID=1341549 RepID=UPI003C774985